MSQHITLGQDACFLVEHSAQQVIGINQTLHQHVGFTLTHEGNSLGGCIVGIGGINVTDVFGKRLQGVVGFKFLLTTHKDGLNKSSLKCLSTSSGG